MIGISNTSVMTTVMRVQNYHQVKNIDSHSILLM